MKSITIHGLDEVLGVKPRDPGGHAKDFEEFIGVWSRSEVDAFEAATEGLRRVEPGVLKPRRYW